MKTLFILLAYIACRSIQVRKRAVVVGLNSDTEAHFIGSTHYYLVKFLAFSECSAADVLMGVVFSPDQPYGRGIAIVPGNFDIIQFLQSFE